MNINDMILYIYRWLNWDEKQNQRVGSSLDSFVNVYSTQKKHFVNVVLELSFFFFGLFMVSVLLLFNRQESILFVSYHSQYCSAITFYSNPLVLPINLNEYS